MLSPPFFSVVIPLYNKEQYIKETLKSVLNQTFDNFEVIIINDGSTDKSFEVAKSFNDHRLKFFQQENQGLSIARNNGIKKSASGYIALIDADDLWSPNHLQKLYNLIQDYPNKGLYASRYAIKKSKKVTHQVNYYKLPEDFRGIVPSFFKHSLQHCVAWVSSICVPKKVFEDMNYFDPEIYSEQDTDLYIRMALKNYEFVLDASETTAIHNKTMSDNLSNYKNKTKVPRLLYAYKDEEKKNDYLNRYIDLNRFSTIVFLKLAGNKPLENELKEDITYQNLSRFQRIVINLPNPLVRLLFKAKDILKLNPFLVFKMK
ncbi:glycosyltransferase family 2 protein [Winogradskyella jejuensis]|uniref:Glycosyl transferase family 2 n=1 Tax=Winogradskyella jejuensis TaxID=1089305 RepID=A0A1M5KA72_9FLAO|nr:glycosyltransferase family 2 protein [Winogradskyella jejuensis]SHG49389.1 Glycosyl transferase family 2 [Winogradskyella jejuensis]